MIAQVNAAACVGCEDCVAICPTGALVMRGGKARVQAQKCLSCGACERECSYEAIRMVAVREEIK